MKTKKESDRMRSEMLKNILSNAFVRFLVFCQNFTTEYALLANVLYGNKNYMINGETTPTTLSQLIDFLKKGR